MNAADKPVNSVPVIVTSLMLVAAIVFLQFYFMGRAIMALNAGLIIAWFVWLSGSYENKKVSKKLLLLYTTGIIIQCFHFAEEYYTGFQEKFPLLFDYTWSDRQFITFNLAWIVIFIVSGFCVSKKIKTAYLFLWFFVFTGEIANGIFHPLLSLYQQSYFPGLYTSFLHFINGILLFRELWKLAFSK
jgi:Protein of unknown function with HXXEE motif